MQVIFSIASLKASTPVSKATGLIPSIPLLGVVVYAYADYDRSTCI